MTETPTPVNYPQGVIPSIGFIIKNIKTTPPKRDEGAGTIQVILEAEKDEVRAANGGFDDVQRALNMHQSTGETVALGLRFS